MKNIFKKSNIPIQLLWKLLYLYANIRYWTEIHRAPNTILMNIFFLLSGVGTMLLILSLLVDVTASEFFLICNLSIPEENWRIASNQTIINTIEECNEKNYEIKEIYFRIEGAGLFLIIVGIIAQMSIISNQIQSNFRVRHGYSGWSNRNKKLKKTPI